MCSSGRQWIIREVRHAETRNICCRRSLREKLCRSPTETAHVQMGADNLRRVSWSCSKLLLMRTFTSPQANLMKLVLPSLVLFGVVFAPSVIQFLFHIGYHILR